ncbi:hypothetical protein SAMN05720766_101207 [Fibrobacter sp. UWH9]|uniref:GNAT family N-acetyltransferase n=1 Tax=Fibrobacter sp. UWH9 TaxID=1896213 RepID=UPI000918FBA4|nr:GNAT family N-acetyltransferase [Fibrobacter sp. UWH9]SHG32865.1 hypothetical protein SAMN05720766_101207 [Fibrobacter sp. UWH9]
MNIIDSFWEKENLGVTSKEVIVDLKDSVDEVKNGLAPVNDQYIVVKIPASMFNITNLVQEMGFQFVEEMIEVEHDLHEVKRNRIHQRLYDSLDYRQMNVSDIETLYAEIDKGMFSSDRISNDPHFTPELSARRYKNWIRQMLNNGAIPYVMSYKGEPAGFIILTTKDRIVYHSVLGGGYEKFRKTGLGMVQKEQEIVKSLGGKLVSTNVSSNNVNQCKALLANGYAIKNINHVFVKHNM